MAEVDVAKLGTHLESWVNGAPDVRDLDTATLDGVDALIEAGMVQFQDGGWDFKLHEKHPNAPRAEFKLMIRKAPGVDTNPTYYRRFTRPSVLQAGETDTLEGVRYALGYPNAGTPIAAAFISLSHELLGLDLEQLTQQKITHKDGKRELGEIDLPYEEGALVRAADDAITGGDTKIEGFEKITAQGLGYAGLSLIVERDPLGTALVRQRTGADVTAAMHWLTIVKRAEQVLDLPNDAVQKELDYALRLFEWNVENNNLGSLPDAERL